MTKGVMSLVSLQWLAYALPFVSLILLLFLFNSTSPSSVGPFGIFTIFVLIYLFWLGSIFSLTRAGIRVLEKLHIVKKANFHPRKVYYIASVVAFVPVLILGMQSVGQLEIWDILLAILFCSLAIFYVVRRTP